MVDYVDNDEHNEQEEVDVVPMSNTVVNVRAMVIEPLNASVTNIAMSTSLSPDYFAVRAEIKRVSLV